jgi:pilus assembly protein CpaB
MLWKGPGTAALETQKVITARVGIDLGSKIEPNMIDVVDWPTNRIPSGAATAETDVIGKYCIAPIYAGQAVLTGQLDVTPTTLQPDPGFFAVAINTETESSSMGKNLIPGNRVDVIWVMTESHEALGGPFSLRLLENVRVLAVGQNSTVAAGADSRRDLKSVTLEVKAKMDENLVLAQELGRLSLAMRNPNDQQTNEPMLVTSISNLLEKAAREKVEERDGPALKAVDQLKGIVEGLARRIESLTQSPASSAALTAESLQRIPAGMRAITIQTPSEATGVAGLLLPGHRVDVVVTWDGQVFDRFNVLARERESRSIVLLENVEVLAVDTQLVARDGDVENKEMSRSVTLIVTLEMGRQISQATEIGTLTLVLRGKEDSLSSEPQLVVNLDQYLGSCLAEIRPIQTEVVGKPGSNSIVPIRLNRGGANQDQMFLLRDPERFPSK